MAFDIGFGQHTHTLPLGVKNWRSPLPGMQPFWGWGNFGAKNKFWGSCLQ